MMNSMQDSKNSNKRMDGRVNTLRWEGAELRRTKPQRRILRGLWMEQGGGLQPYLYPHILIFCLLQVVLGPEWAQGNPHINLISNENKRPKSTTNKQASKPAICHMFKPSFQSPVGIRYWPTGIDLRMVSIWDLEKNMSKGGNAPEHSASLILSDIWALSQLMTGSLSLLLSASSLCHSANSHLVSHSAA